MKLEDEDKALMLLNSIAKCNENFKDVMIYGREAVYITWRSAVCNQGKRIVEKVRRARSNARESYSVRGRQEKMDNNKNNKKFISNQELEIQQKKS